MAEYLGVPVLVAENDPEHLEFLRGAGRQRLMLQRCTACSKLRYPVGNACPFCMALEYEWSEVSGRGTVYSYEVVTHPIHPAFRELVPYTIALVELDEQRGVPTEHDGLRVLSLLVDAEGGVAPQESVAIGLRVQVQFADAGDGLGVPRFTLSDEPPPHEPWRYPG